MNAKHTPGPWVIDPCWDILGNTDDGNGVVCQITIDAVPRPEAESNARLIAAAPDLYEALDNLLRVSEGEGGTKYHAGDIARAAFAKARGEAGE